MNSSKRECMVCHGLFWPSDMSVYKGRIMCDECRGDQEMWDFGAEQERALDEYLSRCEDGEY